MIGQTYNVQPVAPDPEHTVYLDAGPLRIGVEYRRVDPEALVEYYSGDDLAEVQDHSPEGGFSDEGVSIHVESVADDHEYLRFDVFDDDPHYHYVDKAMGTNTLVGFDRAAHGEMLPWVLDRLRYRLDPMLAAAGAQHVGDSLSDGEGTRIADQLADHLTSIGMMTDPTP